MENDNAGLETVEVNDDDEASLDDEDQGFYSIFLKAVSFVYESFFLFQTDLGPVGSFGIYMILQSFVISRYIFEAFSCWVMLISLLALFIS